MFLKDEDYGEDNGKTDEDFKNAVYQFIVRDLFGHLEVRERSELFNFYVAPTKTGNHGGTGLECGPSIAPDGFLTDDCPWADAVAVIHTHYGVQPCYAARVFGAEDVLQHRFIHESGHALFGLMDMYPTRTCLPPYVTYGIHGNM